MSNHVTFLGTGTSQGVPVILCQCEVCLSSNRKDKRWRSSIWVHWNGLDIIVDTGPDFRAQMLTYLPPKIDAVLYTHGHKDHTAGLDDIRAYNHHFKQAIDIYVDSNTETSLKKEFHYIFSDYKYPGIPEINVHNIEKNHAIFIQNEKIQPIQLLHYKLEVYGFRFGNFTYLTDANKIPSDQWKWIKGTETLVLNALRKEKHIAHFTLSEAIEIAHKVGAKDTYFTHISHQMGLHDEVNLTLPKGMYLSYDGLKVPI